MAMVLLAGLRQHEIALSGNFGTCSLVLLPQSICFF